MHCIFLISHFSFLISHFSFLISHFSFLISSPTSLSIVSHPLCLCRMLNCILLAWQEIQFNSKKIKTVIRRFHFTIVNEPNEKSRSRKMDPKKDAYPPPYGCKCVCVSVCVCVRCTWLCCVDRVLLFSGGSRGYTDLNLFILILVLVLVLIVPSALTQ
jgi:hypothetical protein